MYKTALLAVALLAIAPNYASAMTEAECGTAWEAADTNKDSFVTESEAPRFHAALRVNSKTVTDGKLTKTDFLNYCKEGLFTAAKVDAGAPLEGANSFTETQARDRIVAHGLTNVSALTKDDKGIWRGTADQGGKQVKVAVDYKGNVVAQ